MDLSEEGELPEALFEVLAHRIAAVSGIQFPGSKRWLLSSRVADRMRDTSSSTVDAYVDLVLAPDGSAELGHLIEALRVGETQFFRHVGQLRTIRRVALPEIRARRERECRRQVRVWSAGCATGEEAYTLAMMLEQALPAREGWRHQVLATDLSEAALDFARAGFYPAAAARSVPKEIAAWAISLQPDAHGERLAHVTERARRLVRFESRNLLDRVYPRDFDLVLCRNVLIYFDRATQREVMARLCGSVRAGGYLALGYAERLDDSDGRLLPLRTDDGMLYRRADDAAADPSWPPHHERATPGVRSGVAPADIERARPRDPGQPPVRDAEPGPRQPAHTRAGSRAPGGASRTATRSSRGLEGTLEGDAGVEEARRVITRVLSTDRPVLDLRRLEFADARVGRVLSQAAAALSDRRTSLLLVATAPGTLRFLRRHGVVPPAEVVPAPPDHTRAMTQERS